VYDWQAVEEIGVCHDSRSPLCFADNTTLFVSGVTDENRMIKRFLIVNEQLKPVPTFTREHTLPTTFHVINNKHILTGNMTSRRVRFPEWVEDYLVFPLRRFFGLNVVTIKMQVHDIVTHEIRHEFDVRMKSMDGIIYFSMFQEPMFKVSPDGQLIVMQDGDEVSLWDIPPRRSLWCWIICLGICLLALFLAWPRRVVIQR